jgi:hypothetical protein
MKLVRVGVLSRIALLSLAAAAFVGLTVVYYGGSVRDHSPDRHWQAVRRHRPSAPQVSQFLEFVAAALGLALFAAGGRIVFRLRLSPASRSEGQPIMLGLYRGRQGDCEAGRTVGLPS